MKLSARYCLVPVSLLVSTVYGSGCSGTNLRSSPPDNNTFVGLKNFSICDGNLSATAYVANLDYDKVVTLYYTNYQDQDTRLGGMELSYESSIGSDGYWQYWSVNGPVFMTGIAELLNITYQATDIGKTYFELLNIKVGPYIGPTPELFDLLPPYTTFEGFAKDIDHYLGLSHDAETAVCMDNMFRNIDPTIPGDYPGTVVAGRCGPLYPQKLPDYTYNWVRDSSLTFDVVKSLYQAATDKKMKMKYESLLFEYAKARATEQMDPLLYTVDGLGEPKFYLNDTIFTGPWCRPQNDGPATSATALMEFANEYLDNGGSLTTVKEKIWDSTNYPHEAPVKKDLLFTAQNWSSPTCDLWEETYALAQFYDRMVQRKALVVGAAFADRMGDSATAAIANAAASELTPTLPAFWDSVRQIIVYEDGPVADNKFYYLDSAVILGVIHGYANDGVYSYSNEQVLATALRLATSFIYTYPLANVTKDSSGQELGIPIGRFPTDIYNGTGNQPNGGNPWYLCTAAYAQLFYNAAIEFNTAGHIQVTDINKPFFDYFTPGAEMEANQTYWSDCSNFKMAVEGLKGWGDAFIRRIKADSPADGHLHEEYNRNTGDAQGCADLSWSYASVLTAAFARAELGDDHEYVKQVANRGFNVSISS